MDSVREVLAGEQIEIQGDPAATFSNFLPIDRANGESLCFCSRQGEEAARFLEQSVASIVVCRRGATLPQKNGRAYVVVQNPRLAFAKLIQRLTPPEFEVKIHPTALIGEGCRIGRVVIGEYAVIGKNVAIGDGSVVMAGAVVADNVRIGKNTVIKSNAVVGQKGFGFERDENRIPFPLKHLGGVVIGDNVEIGANSVICRGTLADTEIADNVKIDDNVFVAHNVKIGARTLVIAGAAVCGSARIGADCWIAPNSSIMNGIVVGDRVTVGLGAVVLKSVPAGAVVVGNPARIIRQAA